MASENQDLKNASGAVKGTAKTAKGTLDTVKTIKTVAQVAATAGETSNPAGWIMLAMKLKPYADKLKGFLRKVKAGIAAVIGYLLFLLGLKLLGAAAGFVFGAVTGLPLLLVPGVGPFLYAGWVAFWVYRGWMHPLQTIYLATHPWAPLVDAWKFATNTFNTVTGGPISAAGEVGSTIGGVLSTVGNVISGAFATVWGGITGAAGGFLGALTGAANFLIGGLGSAATAVATSGAVAVGVAGTIAGVATLGIINQTNTASSFFYPQGDAVIGGTGDNQYFAIKKEVNPPRILNSELPTGILYTITLTAKINITIDSLTDKLEVQGKNGNFLVTQDKNGKPIPPCPIPSTLAGGASWECQFEITATSTSGRDFTDGVVTNTVTVTATQEGQPPFTDYALAVTMVGTPPLSCPRTWPTTHGVITQGPDGATSHHNLLLLYGEQAIDIADNPPGTPTYSTFVGKVRLVDNDTWGGGYGKHVDIEAVCEGVFFYARWAHLNSIDPKITVGADVQIGQVIGGIDNTGDSTGDHLHYSFFGLLMAWPNIPTTKLPANCDEPDIPCGVSW